MFKLGGLGVICTIVFVLWVSFASDVYGKFDRACAPVDKFGNFMTSMVGLLFDSGAAEASDKWWERADYGCEYTLWRLFYEEDYQRELQQQRLAEEGVEPVADDGVIVIGGGGA